MRIASAIFIFVITCVSLAPWGTTRADQAHEIVLGPADRYDIGETNDWRFEVLRESSGQFSDIRIKPKRGDAFSLTLYFLADPAASARLDSPEKIAASVTAGAERYLTQTVEKKVSLQAIAPRRSYGSLTVLTAANLQGLPGEFKYQTRGMVRLSPDAALGFSLLSKETNTAAYRQVLNYVYSFIRLTPASPRPAAVAATPAVPAVPEAVVTPAPPPARPAAPATVVAAPSTVPAPAAASTAVRTPAPAPAPAATPTPTPQPAPTPAAVVAQPVPPAVPREPERAAPPPRPAPPPPAQTTRPAPRGGDVRDCASLPTNAEIMRCVSGRR